MRNSEAAVILRQMAEASRKFLEEQPTMVEAQGMMVEQQIACDHAAKILEKRKEKKVRKWPLNFLSSHVLINAPGQMMLQFSRTPLRDEQREIDQAIREILE